MSSISEKTYAEQSTIASVANFFTKYQLGGALKRANAYKGKGVPVSAVMNYLISLVYTGKSMFQDIRGETPLARGFCKDTVYRFLNSAAVNWPAFLFSAAGRTVAEIKSLTSDDRLSAFIIDDTMYPIPYAKKVELAPLVYDHAEKLFSR